MKSTAKPVEVPQDIGDFLELKDDGRLFWKKYPGGRAKVGGEAAAKHSAGYFCVGFRGVVYLAHRVVFFLAHGWCPDVVDHIDGDKKNNSPSNLRAATRVLNGINRQANRRKKIGRVGVSWIKAESKWRVEITVRGKTRRLGRYPCLIDAVAARMRAEKEAVMDELEFFSEMPS